MSQELQPEDSRCPPTYRREEAVRLLLGLGWSWDGQWWIAPPPSQQAEFNEGMVPFSSALDALQAAYLQGEKGAGCSDAAAMLHAATLRQQAALSAQPAERQGEVVTDKQVAAAIKTSPELDALIDTESKASIAFAAYRLGLTHPAAPVGVPEPRTWITAHSATRSDVVGMLRDEAHEREQADETTGIFADLAGATLLAAIADALESDTLWAVAAAPSAPQGVE